MKKSLIPLLAGCLLTTVSCNIEDTFYMEGVQDLVTAQENGVFLSDYATAYTLKEDKSDGLWVKGNRYLITFDILNRDYEITLKGYQDCYVSTPVAASEEALAGEDPVAINAQSISGGYVNLHLSYYQKKEGSYTHQIRMAYEDHPEKAELQLFLVHDGNAENPVNYSNEELESVDRLYSFPLQGLVAEGQSRIITLTLYELSTTSAGIQEVTQKNYRLYEQSITF